MTTEAARALYEAQHNFAMEGKGWAIFNPHDRPVEEIEELPVIYGFCNGGSGYFLSAVSIAEDGTVLGSHACSSEAYMPHDLGMLEGTRPDRHEESYQKHFPDGYRCEFVLGEEYHRHKGLQAAIAANQKTHKIKATK